MGSDLNFGSVNVDIMKTSCVINLISVITFLGQCGCDWCKCIVNYQCNSHRRYGDTGTPLNGVLSRKKKKKKKLNEKGITSIYYEMHYMDCISDSFVRKRASVVIASARVLEVVEVD